MIQHLALDALQRHLAGSPLYGWATSLPAQIAARIEEGHGDLARWWSAVQRLPQVPAPKVELAQRFALHSDHDAALQAQVKEALQGLIPWRRGRSTSSAYRSIPNGVPTGNGSVSRHMSNCVANASSTSAAATATTSGACSAPARKAWSGSIRTGCSSASSSPPSATCRSCRPGTCRWPWKTCRRSSKASTRCSPWVCSITVARPSTTYWRSRTA